LKRSALPSRVLGDGQNARSRSPRAGAAADAWGDGPGSQVKPVSRAFQILRFLSETGVPMRAVHVARAVGMHNSTCFNILRTMVAEGILEFHPESKTYTIGIGLVKLLGSTLSDSKRISSVMPLLHGIAERFNVTATLWRRVPPDRIVLVAVGYSPSGGFRIHMGEGQRLPVYAGATGRLFAAFSGASKEDVEAAFRKVRWGRPLSFEAFWRESRAAKKNGWAVDDGNFAQGVLIIDAPVFDREGDIAYSVSTVTFRTQQDEAMISRIGKDLVATSRKITDMLF
jgi:DNA-binding IclR family transcriptional regulator